MAIGSQHNFEISAEAVSSRPSSHLVQVMKLKYWISVEMMFICELLSLWGYFKGSTTLNLMLIFSTRTCSFFVKQRYIF